jgi:DNA-binding IclR family transcriptional regulator
MPTYTYATSGAKLLPQKTKPTSPGMRMTEGVEAVNRALAILAAFKTDDHALSLAELAVRTGLYKSTILRLIASLQTHGFLRRTADGRYCIGPEPARLSRIYDASFGLRDVVMPVLAGLASSLDQTASFYVREGDERVCLYRVESAGVVRVSIAEGERLDIRLGASGKALLAFSGAPGKTYAAIRAQKYATSFGERDPVTAAIAAPVYGPDAKLAGVLNLSGLRHQFSERHVAAIRPALLSAAQRLSHDLGGAAPGPGVNARRHKRSTKE